MPHWIDSHCHLDFPELEPEQDRMIQHCRELGLQDLIIPGVAVAHFQRQQQVAQRYGFHCAYGLHPWYSHQPQAALQLEHWLQQAETVAVGECGLDGLRGDPLDKQTALLEAQLELARQYELPLILHVVKAHEPLLHLLKRHKLPAGGVIHAFQGSLDLAQRYLQLGFYLGIGAAFTRPNASRWRAVLAQLPVQRLLLETDAPAMRPAWVQQGPNRPDYLPEIAHQLADLRETDHDDLLRTCLHNTLNCFPRMRKAHGPE